MANDAYQLQGLDGFDKVSDGEEFTVTNGCKSRGFQVLVSGSFTWLGKSPKGEDISFGVIALDAPSYIGGPIESLAPSDGGEAAVFPTSKDYTIA